jgi:hypothetical protein
MKNRRTKVAVCEKKITITCCFDCSFNLFYYLLFLIFLLFSVETGSVSTVVDESTSLLTLTEEIVDSIFTVTTSVVDEDRKII